MEGEGNGELTRPGSRVRLNSVELAHLTLDPAVERDLGQEGQEGEEGREEGGDGGGEPRGCVHEEGEAQRDERDRRRYFIH